MLWLLGIPMLLVGIALVILALFLAGALRLLAIAAGKLAALLVPTTGGRR